MKIRVTFEHPPIPIRDCDYSAVDDNTYDGSEGCPIGRGKTARAAVQDLAEQTYEKYVDANLDVLSAGADATTRTFLSDVRDLVSDELPDCGGDPRCKTHRGGSHNMTTTKECRR